jgi:hypothetical protein
MKENSPAPERRVRQGMDYGETEDVQQVHAAIQREKREPRVGLEPLSLWLIAIYGLAIFFGGAYLGRYSGDFSGNGLDPLGGAPHSKKSVSGPGGGGPTQELSQADRGKKIFSANCATCHQMTGTGVAPTGNDCAERIARSAHGQRSDVRLSRDATVGNNIDRCKDRRCSYFHPPGVGK